MKALFIGDTHGAYREYVNLKNKLMYAHDMSYQLGDFGFKTVYDIWAKDDDTKSHVLRGNHCIRYSHPRAYTTHFETEHQDNFRLFGIAGANSIDFMWRTEGVTWFKDEELNYDEQLLALDAYTLFKPNIMISHDCPSTLRQELYGIPASQNSSTSNLLQACFEIHQPDIWLFGHHHKPVIKNIDSTEFRCLGILEPLLIEF